MDTQEMKEYKRKYMETWREKNSEYFKNWRISHSDQLKEQHEKWKEKNPEYYKSYYENNKGKWKEYSESQKEYRKNYYRNRRLNDMVLFAKQKCREYKRIDSSKGYDIRNNIEYEWFINNISNKQCYYCGETDWRKLGADRLDNTKPHSIDNCICACKSCNTGRGNRFTVQEYKAKKLGEVHYSSPLSNPVNGSEIWLNGGLLFIERSKK